MKRALLMLVAQAALGLLVASPSTAQVRGPFTRVQFDVCLLQPGVCACNQLPSCPDGSTPVGLTGSCGCQRDQSCPALTHAWQCTFFAAGDSFNPGGWECECAFVGPPDPPPDPDPPPFDPPGSSCAFTTCPDGSTPVPEGLNCLCRG